jgi:hypothetical protein
MKIFGINFTTKKELKALNAELVDELVAMKDVFPFELGQTVYDIALKNDKGRYTKTKPSFEHSTITATVVDKKNYFNLVERYNRNDVFFDFDDAKEYLESICK